jgi:hypothetical protein
VRAVALSLLLAVGCHPALKANVGAIDDARIQVFSQRPPEVTLGRLYTDVGLVNTAVNMMQGFQEVQAEQRIQRAVNPSALGVSLEKGIADQLGAGPPFAYSTSPNADATIQLEVVRYGLDVPQIGARGLLRYDLRVRGYLEDGERFWTTHVRCANLAGSPNEVSMAFGMVNNAGQLERMTDDELQRAFETVAQWCGTELVRKLRRQAG